MQILGNLVGLFKDSPQLPVPWYHRAPLGFMSGTTVYVALIAPTDANAPAQPDLNHRPPDLVVSVLNPASWVSAFQIECCQEDRTGLFHGSLKYLSDLKVNIALAETVTLLAPESPDNRLNHDVRRVHQVKLICGPSSAAQKVNIQDIERQLKDAGYTVNSERKFYAPGKILWQNRAMIDGGVVRFRPNDGAAWRRILTELCPGGLRSDFDFNSAVVSADLESRFLRYVFPKNGAITVKIEHADQPGALECLTEALATCKVNILSSFLRRGGAKAGFADFVANCEPSEGGVTATDLRANIEKRFRQIAIDQTDLELGVTRFPRAARPDKPAFPLTRYQQLITCRDKGICDRIDKHLMSLPKRRVPVFLGRRFVNDEKAAAMVNAVQRTLESRGCVMVQAEPQHRDATHIFSQVVAKLFSAKAGIVLVAELPKKEVICNADLAYELGYLDAQEKPVLLLVQEGLQMELMRMFPNVNGRHYSVFSTADKAGSANPERSIEAIVSSWLTDNWMPHDSEAMPDESGVDHDVY